MIKLRRRDLTTTQIIAFGFLAAIIMGTLLLMLPFAATNGKSTPAIDALFTSTTSICVTGLVTVPTWSHWTMFGQVVILFLIQFGGLGVITFATTILLLIGRRITLKERMLIQDAYNLDTLKGLVKLTIKVIKGTLVIEGMGAILLATVFIPDYGLSGVWKAIFTSVSAFCNAGIDLIGDYSLAPYSGNVILNITIMLLIILGGIGFPVWWDVLRARKQRKLQKGSSRPIFSRLELHTKLVITVTALLVVGGALVILFLEWSNNKTIGKMPWGEKVLASFFQSVTTRTAGFFTIAQDGMRDATTFFCMILMFIGGSPSGTAGGVKTVTIAMMILTMISIVRGKVDTEVFHRRISGDTIRKGIAVILVSLSVFICSTMLLSVVYQGDLVDIMYEAVSALATVGLTRGITPDLNLAAKLIIVATMYIGRIGPISMALFFNSKKGNPNLKQYAEGRIRVG